MVRLEPVGEAADRSLPLARAHGRPRPVVERLARGAHGLLHLLGPTVGTRAMHLFRRGVDDLERAPSPSRRATCRRCTSPASPTRARTAPGVSGLARRSSRRSARDVAAVDGQRHAGDEARVVADARKSAALAISLGWPGRPIGTAAATKPRISSSICDAPGVRPKNCGSIGVSTGPGQIALARIPSLGDLRANALHQEHHAALGHRVLGLRRRSDETRRRRGEDDRALASGLLQQRDS